MSLDPILSTGPVIQTHIVMALLALILGPVALWRKRRDRMHKIVGYVWVLSMSGVALSAFLIPSHFTPIGLGPIHLLAVYALWGIYVAMRAIFQRDIATHKAVMENLYVRGVALAGAFNFLPGRSFQRSFLPDAEVVGFVIIAAVCVWAFSGLFLRRGGTFAKA